MAETAAHLSRRTLLTGAAAAALTAPAAALAPAARAAGVDFVPALVVGSGFGGAVSALRLGAAGIRTLVVEMGRSWTRPGPDGKVFCGTVLADRRAMWFRDRTAPPLDTMFGIPISVPVGRYPGVLDRVQFDEMAVYVGRGFGGGSLVYGGITVLPRRRDLATFLPQVDADEMYRTYFPRARRRLRVNDVPRDWFERTKVYQFARVGRASAARAGFRTQFVSSTYSFDYMQREVRGQAPASATAQEIFFGNNHGKASLDKTYWPRALATGNVTVETLTRVKRVRREPDGTFVVTLVRIDERGRTVSTREVGCRYLFLNAGTLGTNEILLRARETGTLPDLSARIGTGWGNNGNVSVARLNPLNHPTGGSQTTMPIMGIDNRDDPRHPIFAEITPLPTGVENWTTGYLGVTPTPERGRIVYDAAADGIDLRWKRSQSRPAVTALRNVTDRINRVEGTTYRTDLYRDGRTFGDNYTWHPLGGCQLGTVTDAYGRVRGVPHLYVNDGSLLPGYASVNPSLVIAALAERNMDRVLAQDDLSA